MYVAEAGNTRALSRMNIQLLPEVEKTEGEDDEEFEDDEDFDDDFDDEDFDEDFDDFDEEFDEEFDDFDDDEEFEDDEEILEQIPRYINFYLKEPYYVNVNSGHVVTQSQFLALVARQQNSIALAREEGRDFSKDNLLVEELYFPLPEVNVQKIGTIPIPKGIHLKPGFQIVLADRVPVEIKQPSIREEYFNILPVDILEKARTIVTEISPNYGEAGEVVDSYIDGENLDDVPIRVSSSNINLIDQASGLMTLAIDEKSKPGRYKIRIGKDSAEFYIVPARGDYELPDILDINYNDPEEGQKQFIKLRNNQSLTNVKISGLNLGDEENAPVIVPDAKGITVDIVSYTDKEIVFNIKAKKVSLGSHLIRVFTGGGESNSWLFNIEEEKVEDDTDPFIGTYSTVLTLLEVRSLANLPLDQDVTEAADGRPVDERDAENADGNTQDRPGDSGREGEEDDPIQPRFKKSFNLLKSDLESVWKLETVATVNKVSYKETLIIRRTVPNVEAALSTDNRVQFGTSDMFIEGNLIAETHLEESSSSGDITIVVEGEDPKDLEFQKKDRPPVPTGEAVIEDLGFTQGFFRDPASKNFSPGGYVTIVSPSGTYEESDYGIVESLGSNTITIKEPGFQQPHFRNDEVIQFIPSLITPYTITKRDAERFLKPPSSYINKEGNEKFKHVFKTTVDNLANWTGAVSTNTSVPDEFVFDYFEGYFGLNIIHGTPKYTGINALIGQGVLIIDTTQGGKAAPGTVVIGGSQRLPSLFDGVIYIIGDLDIDGAAELFGAVVVWSPENEGYVEINGQGFIKYQESSVNKSIIGLPFTRQLHNRIMERVEGQTEFMKGRKDSRKGKQFKVKGGIRKYK